jgi:prepilin peptidase CpaA
MSGATELPAHAPWAIAAICAVAVATDLTRGKIYNWLTLPALAAGLGAAAWTGGAAALGGAALGTLVGLAAYGPLFAMRVLGGGDVKLLMALGAWGGARYAGETALISILAGGAMALAWLALRGKAAGFAARARRTLVSLVVPSLEFEPFRVDRSTRMPFGMAIATAAVWCAWSSPLRALGVAPW